MKIYTPLLCFFLSGCATHKDPCVCFSNAKGHALTQQEQQKSTPKKDPRDPFESFNRMVFRMNTTLDRTVFLPFIGFYRVMPPCLKNRIISLMDTVETPISMANCLLQGKIHDFLAHTARLVFNTVLGCFGLFDVASALNIKPARQDFGKTLQKTASMKPGPYIVMPFLGPSTLRDCIGQAVDCALLPTTYWKDTAIPYYSGSYLITQAKITSIQQDVSETFSDTYSALRDAYFVLREDADPTEATSDTPPDLLGEDAGAADPTERTSESDTPPDLLGEDAGAADPTERTSESDTPPDLLGEDAGAADPTEGTSEDKTTVHPGSGPKTEPLSKPIPEKSSATEPKQEDIPDLLAIYDKNAPVPDAFFASHRFYNQRGPECLIRECLI